APGRARAGPRAAWRHLTPCPAPWRRSISARAARRERAAASLRRRSPRTYRDLEMIRGREFGSAGLAIAVLALALALLPGGVSPAPEPPPGSWENGWMFWLGRRALGLPPPSGPVDPAPTPSRWRAGLRVSPARLRVLA